MLAERGAGVQLFGGPTAGPSWDLIFIFFHGYRLERNVLSEANAACRLPAVKAARRSQAGWALRAWRMRSSVDASTATSRALSSC